MKFEGENDEYLEIIDINGSNCHILNEARSSELSLIWFKSAGNQLKIDSVDYTFQKNDLLSLTEFHHVETVRLNEVQLIRWARSFYCIIDQDSEVSCKGILYFGASKVPVIHPSPEDVEILSTVMKMFQLEIQSKDNLQLEMLQMMLKRLLILCTRIYKAQNNFDTDPKNTDLIREYNFLVEKHFKEKHTVKEYADLLFKSPKTLSNLFKKQGETTPLKFIQNRIIIEAKRMLTYSNQAISDIGYELGFSDIQVFSRFFKSREGCSPQHFREREKLTID